MASLEITGTGTGGFHIGTVSLMPADNIDGFRPDTTSLLRQINMGFWRYGGNYTSASSGTTSLATSISARRIWTTHGTPCRPTISAWTSS